MNLRSIIVVTTLALATPSMAAEEERTSAWAGTVTLGYLATSGNTENSNLIAGLVIGYTAGQWQHLLEASAISATQADATTAEAYGLGWKSARNLTEHDFVFGRLNWRKDLFSAYDTQFSQSVGYGRRVIDTEVHKLNAEIGVGARQSELIDGSSENDTIGRGGLYYTWQLSDTAEFSQDFVAEAGAANTFLKSVSALSAKLMGNLALVASYTVKNNSDVPALIEKTDTYTALSLEYAF